MSLIQVDSNDIVVGKAPPWPLYDQDRNLLLGEGEPVRDEAHRAELLSTGIYHELSWGISNGNSEPGRPDGQAGAPMQDEAASADRKFTFDDLKLKAEDRLQLEPPQQLARERFTVKVIGFLRGASLLVTMPITANGLRLQLMENEKVVMRSFSGQNAFGFAAYIKKIIRMPYEYLHLTIPENIEGITVRKAPRIKTNIIATVHDDNSGVDSKQSALISDISASGVSLESKQKLGGKGDVLTLAFRVLLHNVEAYLSVRGIIRAVINNDGDAASKSGMIRHGIEFHELRPNDSVILQSMIYQQLIENPQKMI